MTSSATSGFALKKFPFAFMLHLLIRKTCPNEEIGKGSNLNVSWRKFNTNVYATQTLAFLNILIHGPSSPA
jgi:hypothetical protein